MAEEKKTILLEIDINQSRLVKESEEAVKQIARIKESQEELKKANKQGGVEYAVLRAELSKYNKIVSDNAKNIVRINDLTNKETLTRKELFEMQKVLAAEYNKLTAEQIENEKGAKKIAEAYKDVNERLQESGRDVSDYRLLVGNYRKELEGLLKSQTAMRNEQSKIGFVIGESEDKIKDLNNQIENLDKSSIGYAQTEAKLKSELNETNQILEQQKIVYNEIGEQIEETTKKTEQIESEARKIGFTMKSTEEIIEELKQEFIELQIEIENTTGDTSSLEAKLDHTGRRLQSFGVDLNELKSQTKQNSGEFVSLGETMDQLREKGMKLDFQGVMQQLNGLAEISGKLTFSEVKKGVKEFGQTMINLGKNLIKNPIFLLAVAITGIVLAYKEWIEANKTAGKELDKLNKKIDEQNKALDFNNELRKESTNVMIELAKIQGKSAKEIYKLQQKQIEDEIQYNKDKEKLSKQAYERLHRLQLKALEQGDEEALNSTKEQMKIEQDKWNSFIQTNRQAKNRLVLLEAQYNADLKAKNQEAVDDYKSRMKEIYQIHLETLKQIEDLNNGNARLSIENETEVINNTIDLQKRALELSYRQQKNNNLLLMEDKEQANLENMKLDNDHMQDVLDLERTRYEMLIELRKKYYAENVKQLELEAKRELEASESVGEDRLRLEEEINKNLLLKKQQLTEQLNNENKNIVADHKDMEQDILENWDSYQDSLLQIEKDRVQESKELNEQAYLNQIAIIEQLTQLSMQAMTSLFDFMRNQLEVENANIDAMFEKNKQSITDQFEHGFLTEEEYNEKSLKLEKDYQLQKYLIEKKAFENEKQQAMLEAGINTAVAVMKAYATTGPIAGSILAGIIGGIGAIQLGLIAAKQFPSEIPGYALSGLVTGKDGLPIRRSNGDNILATVKTGEVVLNKKHQAMLGGDAVFKAIGVPGFATSGLVNNLQTSRITSESNVQSLVSVISKMPNPIVSVQDIITKLVEVNDVEVSSKF